MVSVDGMYEFLKLLKKKRKCIEALEQEIFFSLTLPSLHCESFAVYQNKQIGGSGYRPGEKGLVALAFVDQRRAMKAISTAHVVAGLNVHSQASRNDDWIYGRPARMRDVVADLLLIDAVRAEAM